MPDIFDIGMRLSLASNVGAGLRTIARDLLLVRGDIGRTQADLDRLRATVLGGLGLRIGVAALAASAAVPGTTVSGNLSTINTLRATVGTSAAARAVLPDVARDEWILRHNGQSTKDINDIIKSIEMLGMATGANGEVSPARFAHALDLFTAGMNLDPKALLRGTDIRNFAKMAQPIASLGGNPEQFVRDYFELITQMGRTAGRGVAYMGIKLIGGQLTKAQEATLLRLNLVTPAGIGGTKGHPFLKQGAIKGYDELVSKGIVAWFNDVFLPQLHLHFGMNPNGKTLATVLSGLAGFPVTSQRALATNVNIAAMTEKFNEQLDKELPKLNEVFGQLQNTMSAQLENFDSALSSFFEVLGVGATEDVIPFLRSLTGAIQEATLFIGKNPGLATAIDDVALAFGTFAGVNGGVMVARGALGMLRLAIPDLAAALGPFAAGGAAAMALRMLTSSGGLLALAVGIEALGKAIPSIPQWLVRIGDRAALGASAGRVLGLPGAAFGGLLGAASGVLADVSPGTPLFDLSRAQLDALKKLRIAQHLSPLPPSGVVTEKFLREIRGGEVSTPSAGPPPPIPPAVTPKAAPLPSISLAVTPKAPLPIPLASRPPPLPPAPLRVGGGDTPVSVHVTSPVSVNLPMPPMSPTDLRLALEYAMLHTMTPAMVEQLAREIAEQHVTALEPLLEKASARAIRDARRQAHTAARGSMADHGDAAVRLVNGYGSALGGME